MRRRVGQNSSTAKDSLPVVTKSLIAVHNQLLDLGHNYFFTQELLSLDNFFPLINEIIIVFTGIIIVLCI